MNTTEVYIEPLFVGFLVLLAVALPWFPELAGLLNSGGAKLDDSLPIKVVFGGLTIGAAYLIGVIVDRFIDTALGPIEQHYRLRFACKQIQRYEKDTGKPYDWKNDPYPEDQLRANIMREAGEAANAWIDGLRTRIRLMRAAAFTFPLIMFGLTILLRRNCDWKDFPSQSHLAYLPMLVAVLPFIVVECLNEWKKEVCEKTCAIWLPPKTNKLHGYAKVRDLISENPKNQKSIHDILFSTFSIYLLILLLASLCPLFCSQHRLATIGLVTAIGTVLTLLAFWAWWRTTKTFMHYLVILNPQPLAWQTRRR